MLKIEKIERRFVKTFIKRERQERSLIKLRSNKKRADFLDKFNHNWSEMIKDKYLKKLETKSDSDTFAYLKSKLEFKDDGLCYIISYDENDGKLIKFKTAFQNCQSIGYAGLIIGCYGLKYYLKTEQVKGAPNKYVGINNK